ncbi:MAG: sugar phosphate isomerase/epimerase [Clostridiaceae bacterium]|nr:sugar phosphate isomerase/epimerase [Clostridiaceae bacterium]
MKFGVFSVSMPEYGIEETAKVLKELGYDGVEFRVSTPAPKEKPEDYCFERRYWSFNQSTLDIGNIGEESKKAKRICDNYGLEIYSLTTYLKPHEADRIENVLKASSSIGCKNIRVFPPNYDETENYRTIFSRTIEELKIIEKLAAQYNVRVNIEIHMNTIIPSASAAYRLVSGFNPQNIGIIFDPGNMVHEGFENYKLGLELLGEYLAYVHVKNAAWVKKETTKNGSDIYQPVSVPLTKGFANLEKLMAVLHELGYDGYISVEDFSNEEDTLTKLRNNLAYLKKLI